MKRILVLLLTIALLACGCGASDGGDTASITTAQLDQLFEENLYCVRKLFVLGTLPYADDPVQGEHIYPVISDRFSTYAALEDYLHTVYTDAEVARLLDVDGEPIYTEVDGKLCVDTHRIGGKPYTVDWDGHTIEITARDERGCSFVVIGKYVDEHTDADTEPAQYRAEGRAVYEDGTLLLEEMII